MSKYLFSISIIACNKGSIRSILYNGIADLDSVFDTIIDIDFKDEFNDNIINIKFNINDLTSSDYSDIFCKEYNNENLHKCIEELIVEVKHNINNYCIKN